MFPTTGRSYFGVGSVTLSGRVALRFLATKATATFEALGLEKRIVDVAASCNWSNPSRLQSELIPKLIRPANVSAHFCN